jgi:hypothetical protein
VYSTTNTRDHEVRNVLIRATKTHLSELLPVQEFKDIMFEFGEFSGGLVVDGQAAGTSYCTSCSSTSQLYCSICAIQRRKCISCTCMAQLYCGNCRHNH